MHSFNSWVNWSTFHNLYKLISIYISKTCIYFLNLTLGTSWCASQKSPLIKYGIHVYRQKYKIKEWKNWAFYCTNQKMRKVCTLYNHWCFLTLKKWNYYNYYGFKNIGPQIHCAFAKSSDDRRFFSIFYICNFFMMKLKIFMTSINCTFFGIVELYIKDQWYKIEGGETNLQMGQRYLGMIQKI